jgi:hypothetical protein
MRYGDLPPWTGAGKGILHMITWRIENWADMPTTMREYVEAEQKLWRLPPASLAEVRALQKD